MKNILGSFFVFLLLIAMHACPAFAAGDSFNEGKVTIGELISQDLHKSIVSVLDGAGKASGDVRELVVLNAAAPGGASYGLTVDDMEYISEDLRLLVSLDLGGALCSASNTVLAGGWMYEHNSIINIALPEGLATIENGAIDECPSLVSVTFPTTLAAWGDMDEGGVFHDCDSMRSVAFNKGIATNGTFLISGDKEIYSSDGRTLYLYLTTGAPYNETVTNVFACALNHNLRITSLSLPSAKEIGALAFENAEGLTSVFLPSVERVCDFAFEDCLKLTSISLPSAKIIGGDSGSVFCACTNLKFASLPSVETIKLSTFFDCKELTSVLIPSVKEIEMLAFAGCDKLTELILGPYSGDGNYSDIAEIPPGVNLYVPRDDAARYAGHNAFQDASVAAYDRIVTFDSRGGTEVPHELISGDITVSRATRPEDPERAGHTFGGWLTAPDGTALWNFDDPVSAYNGVHMRLHALWIPIPVPAPPSSDTLPRGISIMLGGVRYDATRQADGNYLIVLPQGTDVSNIRVSILLPAKATVSPDTSVGWDFTGGPLNFTVTAEDGVSKAIYRLDVRAERKVITEEDIVAADISTWLAIVDRNEGGSLAVELRAPFAEDFEPSAADRFHILASSLTNISSAFVDGDENASSQISREADWNGMQYLRINGTAADTDAFHEAELFRVSCWFTGDQAECRQDLSPPVRLGNLKIEWRGKKTDPVSTGSSGCSAQEPSSFAMLAATHLAAAWILTRGQSKKSKRGKKGAE